MKLIVGLGNPGEKYKNTRHNAGFMVVDELAKQKKLIWEDSKTGKLQYCWFTNSSGKIELIRPQTFMNNSGEAVSYAKRKHGVKLKDIYIVHDDLDIPLGSYKIQFGKGPKDHNGLNDIYEKLGTKDFWHVRVGIENRRIENKISGYDYVLENFTSKELDILQLVIKRVVQNLTDLIAI